MAERITQEERAAGFVYGQLPRSPSDDGFVAMVSSSLMPGASSKPEVFRDIGNGRIILKTTAPNGMTTYPVMEWNATLGHYEPVERPFHSVAAVVLQHPVVRH